MTKPKNIPDPKPGSKGYNFWNFLYKGALAGNPAWFNTAVGMGENIDSGQNPDTPEAENLRENLSDVGTLGAWTLFPEIMGPITFAHGVHDAKQNGLNWQNGLEMGLSFVPAAKSTEKMLWKAYQPTVSRFVNTPVGKRFIETTMRTGETIPDIMKGVASSIKDGSWKRIFNYIKTGDPVVTKAGTQLKPYWTNKRGLLTGQDMYTGFSGRIPPTTDAIDTYLYGKPLDPKYFEDVTATEGLGIHENYVKTNYPNKDVRVYKVRELPNDQITESDLKNISNSKTLGLDSSICASKDQLTWFDAAGHVGKVGFSGETPVVMEQDIWKFNPMDYSKRWGLGKWIMEPVDKAGTPFIVKTNWYKDPNFNWVSRHGVRRWELPMKNISIPEIKFSVSKKYQPKSGYAYRIINDDGLYDIDYYGMIRPNPEGPFAHEGIQGGTWFSLDHPITSRRPSIIGNNKVHYRGNYVIEIDPRSPQFPTKTTPGTIDLNYRLGNMEINPSDPYINIYDMKTGKLVPRKIYMTDCKKQGGILKRVEKYENGNSIERFTGFLKRDVDTKPHMITKWENFFIKPEFTEPTEQPQNNLFNNLMTAVQPHLGTKYLWGGKSWSQKGVDCSGFTNLIYKELGVNLSTGSMNQFKKDTEAVDIQNAKVGDLVFLKGTIKDRGQNGISHVGILLGINEDGSLKVAESCGKGVSINDWNLQKGFHAKHFAGIRRIKEEKLA